MPLAKKYRHQGKVIPLFTDEQGEPCVHLSVDIDPVLYAVLQARAKREHTTEQKIIMDAILEQLKRKQSLHTNTRSVVGHPNYMMTARKQHT